MIEFAKINTVLFDFDGTLVRLNLNFPKIYQGLYSILEKYGIDPAAYKGLFLIELIETVTDRMKKDDRRRGEEFNREAEAFLRKEEAGAAQVSEVIPGACRTLRTLNEKKKRLAIITRNCQEAVRIGLGKEDFIYDLLLTRDDIRPVKPEPHSLRKALDTFASKPEETIMVGDHPIDVRVGKKVGVKTVAVLSGQTTKEDFKPFEPDLILPSVKELLEYF
jgi:phosphoglycolate phosphatase